MRRIGHGRAGRWPDSPQSAALAYPSRPRGAGSCERQWCPAGPTRPDRDALGRLIDVVPAGRRRSCFEGSGLGQGSRRRVRPDRVRSAGCARGFGTAPQRSSGARPVCHGDGSHDDPGRRHVRGPVDLSSLTTINDIVTIDGRHYQAMSLLPTIPYCPGAVPRSLAVLPLGRLGVIGIVAGWLALPLARRYGPAVSPTTGWRRWAHSGRCSSPDHRGDFYYLAHLEATLLLLLT